jgi:hypothetical protein
MLDFWVYAPVWAPICIHIAAENLAHGTGDGRAAMSEACVLLVWK